MFISPVPRKSVQGRGEYVYVKPDGTPVPADRSFAKDAEKRYSFPQTVDGTSLNTGLDRLVSNPWYNKTKESIRENLPAHLQIGASWNKEFDRVIADEQISKQFELEVRFNLEEGTLTSQKNLDHRFKQRKKDAVPTFLEKFYVILYDRANRFEDTTLRSALVQELAKVSGKIASSKANSNPSMHHFYISEENEADIERTIKADIVNDAIADLVMLRRNHDPFFAYQVAVVLKKIKGAVAPVTVKDTLNEFIASSNKRQLNNIKQFNNIIKLIAKGAEGMNKLWIMYCLQQAVNTNVISISGGSYIWHSKKGIDNLHNLGTNQKTVLKLFYEEFQKFQGEDDETENWYKDLLIELRSKGVKLSI